jgi:hypothetical protein
MLGHWEWRNEEISGEHRCAGVGLSLPPCDVVRIKFHGIYVRYTSLVTAGGDDLGRDAHSSPAMA